MRKMIFVIVINKRDLMITEPFVNNQINNSMKLRAITVVHKSYQ